MSNVFLCVADLVRRDAIHPAYFHKSPSESRLLVLREDSHEPLDSPIAF